VVVPEVPGVPDVDFVFVVALPAVAVLVVVDLADVPDFTVLDFAGLVDEALDDFFSSVDEFLTSVVLDFVAEVASFPAADSLLLLLVGVFDVDTVDNVDNGDNGDDVDFASVGIGVGFAGSTLGGGTFAPGGNSITMPGRSRSGLLLTRSLFNS